MKKELEKLLEDKIDTQIDHERYYSVDYSGIAQSIVDMVVEKLQDIQNQNVKMVENGIVINAINGGYSLNNHQQKINNYIEDIIHSLKQD